MIQNYWTHTRTFGYRRYDDDHPSKIDYETVEPGDYLAYSSDHDFLYDSNDADWRQFYDRVTEDGVS